MMLSHALASLKKVRVLALAGLALPLPLIAFSVYVFDHYLKYWYKDPFVLGILAVFLLGQFMAVRENISLLGGLGKCRRLLLWLQNQAQLDADGLLGGLQALPSSHLRDVVENSVRSALSAEGAGVATAVLDNAANRRMARDTRTMGLQVAVNRTTLKLGFLGTLIGLLLTFTPMKDAILALRDSGGEMKFVSDIAKAIDGDYFAIYTTLLATGLSLLIEMVTLQLLERALGRFEAMNSFVDEWLLVDLEPRIKALSTGADSGLAVQLRTQELQRLLGANLESLSRAVAESARRTEEVLRLQEALGKRVDRLIEYDRDSLLRLENSLGGESRK